MRDGVSFVVSPDLLARQLQLALSIPQCFEPTNAPTMGQSFTAHAVNANIHQAATYLALQIVIVINYCIKA